MADLETPEDVAAFLEAEFDRTVNAWRRRDVVCKNCEERIVDGALHRPSHPGYCDRRYV